MWIRRFLTGLFSSRRTPRRAPADPKWRKIREAMGPQASGGTGGRMTGHAVYELFEDDEEHDPAQDEEVT